MRRQFLPSIVSMVIFTVVLGIGFPLVVLGISQIAFHEQANGSIIECKGQAVGSSLIGQAFTDAKGEPLRQYFQSRPSAAVGSGGDTAAGYDPTLSSGSNLGPTNPAFLKAVARRVTAYRELNGLSDEVEVPVDAVTSSGSGLDPDISIANARLQVSRVARARNLSEAEVDRLVDDHTSGRDLGILGEKAVNVVELNLALDRLDGRCS
jgi:potassium-transporting ATPase KdpC subunit